MTEYARRDARALEPYYYRHVSAMTRERLNAKSDIAAELAWRDKMIAELTTRTVWLKSQIDDICDPLNQSMVAATPDLLEACSRLLGWSFWDQGGVAARDAEFARAAIRKATGGKEPEARDVTR